MDQAHRTKQRAALLSILASSALTLAKLAAGLASGSLALLSEAGHNLVDTGITIVTFFAIKIAGKPADEDHPYGHGKVEAVAALIETGFLFALTGFILVEAVSRLRENSANVNPTFWAFGVLVISILVDVSRIVTLSRIARRTKSDALAADVLHFTSDAIGSFLALCGLAAAGFGFQQGDAIAALGVALFIGIAGYRLGRRTINTLIDTAPKGLTESIRQIIADVPGVSGVEALRLRPVGAETLGDVSIFVPRTLPLEKVAAIKEAVNAAIAEQYPEVALAVTTHPIALDDETVLERLLLIAAKRHTTVHNVIVQEVEGRFSIGFDVEVDAHMPLGQAHEIATALEADTRREFGSDVEVDSHIEPREPRELPGRDTDSATRDQIAAALAELAREPLVEVHSVRVRQTPAGLVVNYHCRANPELSVETVHLAV
ncbi:MAG TPA: cation diffusion facilitator family transporter, partial [Methylovirgula sp.]|nr:cation diffusion facilitator family transporter [Methylovirgula sp.]